MNLVFAAILAATTLIPLTDLGNGPYDYGWTGGLWENGSNTAAPEHLAAGLNFAKTVVPRDVDGTPSANGKIVFLAAGNATADRIACGGGMITCTEDSLFARAAVEPRFRRRDKVVFVNGADPYAGAAAWASARSPEYDRIENSSLAPQGVSEKQVQVAWIILANSRPELPVMPVQYAEAYNNKIYVAETVRAMRQRYPNLAIVYLSSSVYRGYSAAGEPYGYEDGYTTKMIVSGQAETMRIEGTGPHWDTRMGNLSYTSGGTPWLTWGPYLWANGTQPRKDGLTWLRQDFEADGETLRSSGVRKGADAFMDFLFTDPTTRVWLDVESALPRRRASGR